MKKKLKLIVIAVVVLLLLGGGAFAAMQFGLFGGGKEGQAEGEDGNGEHAGEHDGDHGGKQAKGKGEYDDTKYVVVALEDRFIIPLRRERDISVMVVELALEVAEDTAPLIDERQYHLRDVFLEEMYRFVAGHHDSFDIYAPNLHEYLRSKLSVAAEEKLALDVHNVLITNMFYN